MKVWLAAALCALLSVTGCGFKDVDKRFFVLAMGVDQSGDPDRPYRITIKLGIPSAKIEPGLERDQILTQDSDSITEAVRLLKSKVDKELDFGHTKMIVFGEEVARDNIREPFDWFERRRDISNIAFLAIGSPNAESILRISPKSERLPGNALFLSFGGSGTESSYIVTVYKFDFSRRLRSKGLDPVLPVIEPLPETYRIDKVAIFDKQRVKAILSANETRVFNQLANQFEKFDLKTETANNQFLLAVQKFSMKYKIEEPKGARPVVNINIKVRGAAEESLHPLYEEDWRKLEQETAELAEKRYIEVLQKLQELGVDPVGFGLRYRATHYNANALKTWQALYPDVDFQVHVHIHFLGTGVIK